MFTNVFSKLVLNTFYINLLNSFAALFAFALMYMGIVIFVRSKIPVPKVRKRVNGRILYVLTFIFVCVLARIWVVGFTQIVAVLGLVGAALVVANKESVMNVIGFSIISWRDLFTEEEYIQIQQYEGYVKTIGLLYFTIYAVDPDNHILLTGNLVKIPNGLVMTAPLVNYSRTNNLLLQKEIFPMSVKSSFQKIYDVVLTRVTELLNQYYEDHADYFSLRKLHMHFKLSKTFKQTPTVILRMHGYRQDAIEVVILFYCYRRDYLELKKSIVLMMEKIVQENEDICWCG